jgi:hypothetical protein
MNEKELEEKLNKIEYLINCLGWCCVISFGTTYILLYLIYINI